MNVSLTAQLEELVQEKVSSGRYHSASEVIREALRLLEERDQLRELKLQALKRDIALGIEQADRGELVAGDEVFEELRARNKARSRKRK